VHFLLTAQFLWFFFDSDGCRVISIANLSCKNVKNFIGEELNLPQDFFGRNPQLENVSIASNNLAR